MAVFIRVSHAEIGVPVAADSDSLVAVRLLVECGDRMAGSGAASAESSNPIPASGKTSEDPSCHIQRYILTLPFSRLQIGLTSQPASHREHPLRSCSPVLCLPYSTPSPSHLSSPSSASPYSSFSIYHSSSSGLCLTTSTSTRDSAMVSSDSG